MTRMEPVGDDGFENEVYRAGLRDAGWRDWGDRVDVGVASACRASAREAIRRVREAVEAVTVEDNCGEMYDRGWNAALDALLASMGLEL